MIEYRKAVAVVMDPNGGCRPATVEEVGLWRQLQSAGRAIRHYEAALKEAFPCGATGKVFDHWNDARKELG